MFHSQHLKEPYLWLHLGEDAGHMACLCSGLARRGDGLPGLPDAPPLSTDQLIAKWQADNSTERDEGYHSYRGPTSSTCHQEPPGPAVATNSARWGHKRAEIGRKRHAKSKKVAGEKLRQSRWASHVRQTGWDSNVRQAGWDSNVRQNGWDNTNVRQAGRDSNVQQAGWDSNVRQAGWDTTNVRQAGWDPTNVRLNGWDTTNIQQDAGLDTDSDQNSPELDEPPFTVFDRQAERLIHSATRRRPANVQAVVINAFASGRPDQLNVERGDVVRVLYRSDDWVRVANVWRDRGFIPYSYVWPLGRRIPRKPDRQRPWSCPREERENDPPDSPDLSDDDSLQSVDDAGSGFFARLRHGPALTVLFDFRAIDEDDVTALRGETVTLLNEEDADWVWVRNRAGREGFIPRGYAVQTCEACRTVLRKNLQKRERDATKRHWEQAHSCPQNENAPPQTSCPQLADDFLPPQDCNFVVEEQSIMSLSQKVALDTWQGNRKGGQGPVQSVQRPEGWQKVPHRQLRTELNMRHIAKQSTCTCATRRDRERQSWQADRKEDSEEWPQTSYEEPEDLRGNSQEVIRNSLRKITLSDYKRSLGKEKKGQCVTGLPLRKHTVAAKKPKGVCSSEKDSLKEQKNVKTSLKEQEAGPDCKESPWWNLEMSQDCAMILRENAARGKPWEQAQDENFEQEQGQTWEEDQHRTWEQERDETWEQEESQLWEQDSKTWEQEQDQTWEQDHCQTWEQDLDQTWEQEQDQTWEQEDSKTWVQDQGPTWEQEDSETWEQEQDQTWEQDQDSGWEQEQSQTWEQDQGQTWEQKDSATWAQDRGQNWEQEQNQAREQAATSTSTERLKLLKVERATKLAQQNYSTQLRRQAVKNMQKHQVKRNSNWRLPTGHSPVRRGKVYISKLETAL
ncbi:hypothetical protein Bbelb_097690 [Branchiostoma belcheri]|nr:hypothetical protein Bbelb_097690 [Branchiostoma belcheri]